MSKVRKTLLKKSKVTVITEEMPDVESSTIGVWVKTGSRFEPTRTRGISHFIEHLLFKGTRKRTALDIAREIESVGGNLNAFTGREYTCFYAKVLNKDIPLAIDLLSDILLNSTFNASELERERSVVLQEIKMVEDTPDDLIHDLFAERFWQGHPIASPVLGSMETVSSITRDDVREHFGARYNSSNIFISAAGGFSHKAVLRLLDSAFKTVRDGNPEGDGGAEAPEPSRGVKLVKRDLEQVHFCIGVPAVSQAHPERYRYYLLNTILGGGMSSRLFQEIREKRGLAYSVYSYLSLMKDAGSLVMYAGTSKAEFGKVVGLVLKEYAKLRKGVESDELKRAKRQLKGGMLLGLEASDSRMMKLARDEMYFGRHIPVEELVRGIDRVRLVDVKEIAAKALRPGNMTVVAIGKVTGRNLPRELKR